MTAVLEAPARLPAHRVGALAAAVVAVGHLPLAVEHATSAYGLLLGLLALGCAHCAVCLWRSGARRGWALAAAMGGLMLLAHLPLPGLAHSHASAAVGVVPLVVAGAEGLLLVLAVVALLGRQRGG